VTGSGESARYDVLVLGGAGVDTVVYVPQLPLPFADSYAVPAIQTRAGQTGDGVALGVHALGLRAHHIDMVGEDPEGVLVRELHARRGVAFTAVPTAAGTKRAVNLVSPDGRRLSLYDASRGADGDRLPADELSALTRASRHVHVSITHPCQAALPLLGDASVSTDLHDWDGQNPYHTPFAHRADIVFLSAAALIDVAGTMLRILAEGRAHTVVATAGSAGAHLLVRGDPAPGAEVVRHVPVAPLPGLAIDSNGAGDAFVSGYLFGFLTGEPEWASARLGAVAGAHACTVPATAVDPIDRATLRSRAHRADPD
jgi:sugar/nucleoside kinase (ribokinase family)